MKRSNIIFFSLISVLFIIPFILFGVYYFLPGEKRLTGFHDKYKNIIINNPDLNEEDVKIILDDNTDYPNITIESKKLFDRQSYIYYESNDQNYIPYIESKGDTLIIGKPKKGKVNEKVVLNISIKSVKKVFLNGKTLWDETGTSDDYTYIPSLTEKINAFVESSVSLQNHMKKVSEHGKNVESVAWVSQTE